MWGKTLQRCESYYEFEIEKCQPDQVVGEVEKLKADQQEAMVGLLYIVKISDLTLICLIWCWFVWSDADLLHN